MPENSTSDALPGGANVSPSDGNNEAVTEIGSGSVAAVLSATLGKVFPTDDAAIKAVKDTFSFVNEAAETKKTVQSLKQQFGVDDAGLKKLMENLASTTTHQPSATSNSSSSELASKVSSLEAKLDESTFYSDNPDLKPYAGLLGELRQTTGKSLSEVAKSDAVKGVIDKAKAHDESEKSRSILQSNPRLGQVQNKLTEARDAVKSGNYSAASAGAISAVIDSMKS